MINKEEIINEVIGSFKMTVDTKGLKKLEKYIDNIEQENQQLKDRINKAVEYINDLSLDFYDYECEQLIVGKYMINELLKILKGDNKEKVDEKD